VIELSTMGREMERLGELDITASIGHVAGA
jgi:hypothetical protein